jgi:hypothetical protein
MSDLDKKAAELVMRWKVNHDDGTWKNAYDKDGRALNVEATPWMGREDIVFMPASRWDHAGMVIEEMARKGLLLLVLPPSSTVDAPARDNHYIAFFPNGGLGIHTPQLTPAAITAAAVAATEEGDG